MSKTSFTVVQAKNVTIPIDSTTIIIQRPPTHGLSFVGHLMQSLTLY